MYFQKDGCILGDIGGSLGLFIGASVITVFELFDVIAVHLHKTYAVRDGNKQKQGADYRRSNFVTAPTRV